jgi:hypothetical protein
VGPDRAPGGAQHERTQACPPRPEGGDALGCECCMAYEYVISTAQSDQMSAYPTMQMTIWELDGTAQQVTLEEAQNAGQFALVLSTRTLPNDVSKLTVPCANCPGGALIGIRLGYVLPSGATAWVVESGAPPPKGGNPVLVTVRDPATVEIVSLNGVQALLYYTSADHSQLAAIDWVTTEATAVSVYFRDSVEPTQGINFARSIR